MRERGLFMVDIKEQRMFFSRVRAVFVADKWAPYMVNFPRYEKWQKVLEDFVGRKDCP